MVTPIVVKTSGKQNTRALREKIQSKQGEERGKNERVAK
jgi:hypothetical protein